MRGKKSKRLFSRYATMALLLVMAILFISVKGASSLNPQTINFQGKVVSANGMNVADNTYTFVFKLYTVASGGSALWTESKSVVVTNGVFQTALGDTCPLNVANVCNASTPVDFNANPSLYLGILFAGDVAGEMIPRVQMSSVPYAFNSDKLGGLDSTNFVRLGQGVQTDASTANPSIFVNKTAASGNILQLQKAGTDVFSLSNTGLAVFTPSVDSAAAFVIQRATAADTLLSADTTTRSASGGNLIKIGNSTGTDGALTILRLDSATADPTSNLAALTGGLFYRSDTGDLKYVSASGVIKTLCNKTDLACMAATDLNTAYTNSTSPATITLTDAKNFVLTATDTATDSNILVNLQCATCSADGGKFAVQDNGTDVLIVNPTGSINVTPTAGQSVITSLGGGSQARFNATAPPTTDLVKIDNTGQAVTTNGVSGLQINYVGGAGAVEASGARIDLTPGSTSGSTWNGLRIVANATGSAAGVTENGIKLEGPTTPGSGTDVALVIDAKWDAGIRMETKSTDPATPPTDNIYVYAQKIAGRGLLGQMGASGVSFAYQPAIFEQAISYVGPNNTTTVSSFGSAWTIGGTLSTPAASETFGYTMNFITAATANTTSGISQNNTQWFRGSVAGSNGFFFVTRIGTDPGAAGSYGTTTTGSRIFAGLSSTTTSTITGSDNPIAHVAGFQYSTTSIANWRFITRDSVVATNGIDTGMVFAINKVYDVYAYTPPQGASIFWRIDNLTDGSTFEGSTATNLPGNNVSLRAGAMVQTLTTTARNLKVAKMYIEADR